MRSIPVLVLVTVGAFAASTYAGNLSVRPVGGSSPQAMASVSVRSAAQNSKILSSMSAATLAPGASPVKASAPVPLLVTANPAAHASVAAKRADADEHHEVHASAPAKGFKPPVDRPDLDLTNLQISLSVNLAVPSIEIKNHLNNLFDNSKPSVTGAAAVAAYTASQPLAPRPAPAPVPAPSPKPAPPPVPSPQPAPSPVAAPSQGPLSSGFYLLRFHESFDWGEDFDSRDFLRQAGLRFVHEFVRGLLFQGNADELYYLINHLPAADLFGPLRPEIHHFLRFHDSLDIEEIAAGRDGMRQILQSNGLPIVDETGNGFLIEGDQGRVQNILQNYPAWRLENFFN